MKTDTNQHPVSCHLKDIILFFLGVAAGTFLLAGACAVTGTTEIVADATPVLAVPRPPAPLALAPEPAPPIAVVETAPTETQPLPAVSSIPDKAVPHEAIPFHGIIVQAAGRYEVDPHLIRAIIFAESGYNPRAKSKKGARGLMQLMPSTARSLGVEDIYDPEENIDGGVRYFRSLLDRFGGDVQLALAAYNAGSRHVRNYEGIPPFKATRHYINKVLKFHEKFKMENTAGSRRLA